MDEPALVELAGRFAQRLAPPLVLYLEGDLGAGKTTFVRALLRALGYEGAVKSPTYGLLELYDLPRPNPEPLLDSGASPSGGMAPEGRLQVIHLDLYRIADPGEVEYLGLADLLDGRSILCVEWPEQGGGALPAPDLVLALEESVLAGPPTRDVHAYAYSDSGIKLCELIDLTL
ncbi:MAG: tRNA (adenosine(37)-N6)-threonylcarbamoyltransferase complex ATPase subunit type 1 TsaE [Xanthomonadales bacterium]|nr:tRNA (adenosine(37)-N6)-threonylcarbamoyltransferase complex ATPase subunit type 1 TsaE [Xanthomonadales bacterium]